MTSQPAFPAPHAAVFQLLAELKTGLSIHLPTESEWECACRAGTETEYESGESPSGLDDYAWYEKNAANGTHPVATKRANGWGLFDMEGNVREWCADRWHDSYLLTRNVKEKDGSAATERVDQARDDGSAWERKSSPSPVLRGGGWADPAGWCRCACRNWEGPSVRGAGIGFRLACH